MPTLDPDFDAAGEALAHAEHQAALEATLFATGPSVVFELRDGALQPVTS